MPGSTPAMTNGRGGGHQRRKATQRMNSLRHAVILAAGMATRLRPASNLLPKGLFEIGGASLLGRSVDLLAAAGVAEILVVTGHHAQQVEAALGTERGGATLRYV